MEELKKQAKYLTDTGIAGDASLILVKDGGAVKHLAYNKDGVTADGGDVAIYEEILAALPESKVLAVNGAQFSLYVGGTSGAFVPAVLDDVAQIIGRKTYIVHKGGDVKANIIKYLSKYSACIVEGVGIVACGRNSDEAATAALVAEKGAIAYAGGNAVGKAKKIPFLDAVIMRFVYKQKYSKIDVVKEEK
ncbi:MAG: hypothetical protein LBN25_04000 [Christensenellaceae bacterium]|jgi:L-fuculose-phosphate aldolase|nr:hypothetical protein [Christensenellaceae bacterium]